MTSNTYKSSICNRGSVLALSDLLSSICNRGSVRITSLLTLPEGVSDVRCWIEDLLQKWVFMTNPYSLTSFMTNQRRFKPKVLQICKSPSICYASHLTSDTPSGSVRSDVILTLPKEVSWPFVKSGFVLALCMKVMYEARVKSKICNTFGLNLLRWKI